MDYPASRSYQENNRCVIHTCAQRDNVELELLLRVPVSSNHSGYHHVGIKAMLTEVRCCSPNVTEVREMAVSSFRVQHRLLNKGVEDLSRSLEVTLEAVKVRTQHT
jgi:hypothetical protein